MQHRTSDVLHKSFGFVSSPQVWAAAESVLVSGFCLCEGLPSHGDLSRPCPQHDPTAYMVWECISGRGPRSQQTSSGMVVLTYCADKRLHRIDGLPAMFSVTGAGHVANTRWYVRGERLSDKVHLQDRLYWDA